MSDISPEAVTTTISDLRFIETIIVITVVVTATAYTTKNVVDMIALGTEMLIEKRKTAKEQKKFIKEHQ